jgi:plasmid stability protein
MENKNDYGKINEIINSGYATLARARPKQGTQPNFASKALDEDAARLSSSLTGNNPEGQGKVAPTANYRYIHRQILEDEEVRGFYGFLVDAIVQSGYRLVGDNEAEVKKATKKLESLKFNKFRKGMYFKCLTEFHDFIELIPNKEGNEIAELKHQPNYAMEPIKTKRGVLKGFVKTDIDGKEVKWKLNEMAHISVEDFDGTFWNTPQIVTLERLITLKKFVMEHLLRKFKNNVFKQHFHLQNANEDEVKEIIRNMIITTEEREKFFVTAGTDPLVGKKMDEETSVLPLIELLNKIRNMMLTLIRVPPIIAGTVDNSNRSNSDTQANFTFIMRIKSFLCDIEDEINAELLPLLGFKDVKLKHNTINLKEDKEWLEMGNQLVAMQANKEKVLGWLNDKGLELPEDLFEGMEDEKNENEDKMPFAPNSNLFPSRKPVQKDTADYKSGSDQTKNDK